MPSLENSCCFGPKFNHAKDDQISRWGLLLEIVIQVGLTIKGGAYYRAGLLSSIYGM